MRASNELIIACSNVVQITKEAISDDLQRALSEITKEVSVYATKHRLKDVNSVIKKVQRKLLDDEKKSKQAAQDGVPAHGKPYSAKSVTDIWGFRYVTLFQKDIPPIVRALLQRLEKFNSEHGDFPVRMKEFVVYTNRPLNDPLSIANDTQAIVDKSTFGKIRNRAADVRSPESRESAYSSVHFIFERDCRVQLAGEESSDNTATFEIQIRDIFEEGWGEVQHLLLYSDKDNLEAEPENPNRELWRHHLNALKTFVDGCSQHASIIRQTKAMMTAKENLPSIEPQSVTSREEDRQHIIRALKLHGGTGDTQKAVDNAYASLLAADTRKNTPSQMADYAKAAEDLGDAIKMFRGLPGFAARGGRSSLYFLKMEQANCLFNQGEILGRDLNEMESKKRTDFYVAAADLFREVAEIEPLDPIAPWRFARAKIRIEKSAENFGEAIKQLDFAAGRVKNDPLTGAKHWLIISIKLQKSVVLWLFANTFTGDDKIEMIKKAITASVEAQDEWRNQPLEHRQVSENAQGAHKAASNCLFFAAELMKLGVELPEYDREFIKGQIKFVEELSIERYQEYFKTRDNLMQAYGALGDDKKVISLAGATFNELRSNAEERAGRPLLAVEEIRKYLVESELTSYDTASSVIFKA